MTRMRVLVPIFSALCLVAAGTMASAAEEFFGDGDFSAGWVAFDPAPPGSTENASIALEVNAMSGTDYDDYAGVEFTGLPTAPPVDAPMFGFRSTDTNAGSGGSPRLVMRFSDGGRMELRPLSWTANVWVTIDGAVTNTSQGWDNSGGTCGFLYQTTYSTGLGCHSGATVTAVYIVSDSGWFNPGGYIHYIDDVTYGDVTISYPAACIDDFTGSHENGPVSGAVHDVVEPVLGEEGGTVHALNCDVIVPAGL